MANWNLVMNGEEPFKIQPLHSIERCSMYPSIVRVSPIPDFSLAVAFDDGETRVLDMKPFLDFGVFRRIKGRDAFDKVHISFDTIEWECGVDLDPEFVLARSVPSPL
jgi:hypothetical protein